MTAEIEGAAPEEWDELGPEELETLRSGLRIMALRALGNDESAQDVVQETLARALEALREGRVADRGNLGGFVAGIARHVIADHHRASGRTASLDSLPNTQPANSDPDPLSALISAEDRDRLRAAMRGVSGADREILRLAFYEGLSAPEIAKRLGERADRIRKRKSRAVERLRRAFEDANAPVTERRLARQNE